MGFLFSKIFNKLFYKNEIRIVILGYKTKYFIGLYIYYAFSFSS